MSLEVAWADGDVRANGFTVRRASSGTRFWGFDHLFFVVLVGRCCRAVHRPPRLMRAAAYIGAGMIARGPTWAAPSDANMPPGNCPASLSKDKRLVLVGRCRKEW